MVRYDTLRYPLAEAAAAALDYVENKVGSAGTPEHGCPLAEARAAVSLVCRWQGVLEGEVAEASGPDRRLLCTLGHTGRLLDDAGAGAAAGRGPGHAPLA